MTDSRTLQKGFALLVPGILFGLLVAAQWGTFAGRAPEDVAIRYVGPLEETVTELQAEQDLLKAQVTELRTQLDDLQRAAAAQSGAAGRLQARLDELRAEAGLTAVAGEGIVVTLDAAAPAALAELERPACFAPDLTDITNAAWRGGATAVAIDGERLVASSSVYCVGSTIVVNGGLVSAPFEIVAIGDADLLVAALEDPASLRDLKRRRDERAVVLRVSREAELSVGAYSGPVTVRSARIE